MSVASDITAITTKLATIFDQIKTSLTGKGVSGLPTDYSEVPAKIDSIVTGTGIDTSDATAAASDIRSGKTAYVDGTKVTGNLNLTARTVEDLSVSGRTVSVPAGLYSNSVAGVVASASAATPTISVNTTTGVVTAQTQQSAGYVNATTKTATQSLSSIGASANLVPENIKSGVNIFGVTGTYEGFGSGVELIDYIQANGSNSTVRSALISNSLLNGKGVVGAIIYSPFSQTFSSNEIETGLLTKNGNNYNLWYETPRGGSITGVNLAQSAITKESVYTVVVVDLSDQQSARFKETTYYVIPLIS